MRHLPHVVYRLYDKHDTLLYVGIANDLNSRLGHHTSPTINPWAPYVHRWETADTYPDWASAHAVEVAAIRSERPVFNKHHNPDKGSRADGYRADYAAREPAPDADAVAAVWAALAGGAS